MKASDFRVGNILLDFEGNPISIEAIEILAISQCNVASKEVEFLKPIPITEEWLLNFGFDKFDGYECGFSFKIVPTYELSNVYVQLSESVYHYVRREYDGGTSEPFESVIELHYVHQLQNLYFALTGQELKIKPS